VAFLRRLAAEGEETLKVAEALVPEFLQAATDVLGTLESITGVERNDKYRFRLNELRGGATAPSMDYVIAIRELLSALAYQVAEYSTSSEAAAVTQALRRVAVVDAKWCIAIRKIEMDDLAAPTRATNASVSVPSVNAEAMTTYLRAAVSENSAIRCTDTRVLPGGYSKRTVFVALENSGTFPASLVMRQDAEYDHLGIGTSVTDE